MIAPRAVLLAPLFAVLAYGWREGFVPLVAVAHNQHGAVLATAGLAVAATRIGSWLWVRYGSSMRAQPASRAAMVMALLLVFIGLAPEEGPVMLLLWAAFGLAWPVVQQALLGPGPGPAAALAALLLGLALAGPTALGPGAWLLAAGYLFWSWQLGRRPAFPEQPVASPAARPLWTSALPVMTMSTWLWLVPGRLLSTGLPLAWCGVALALGIAPYALVTLVARPLRWPVPHSYVPLLAASLLVPAVLALALAGTSWQIVALMAICSLLAGLLQGALDPAFLPWALPAEGRALGEVAGPLLGVVLLVVAGSTAVFGGGVLAAAVCAGLFLRGAASGRAGPGTPEANR